jgi:N-acetylmuramoyl-L-alanine amidase
MNPLPAPSPARACALLLAALLLPSSALMADVTAPEAGGKPGFLKRLFTGGGSEKPAEPPAPPPPSPEEVKEAPKAKPAAPAPSSAKREKITIKPKGTVTQTTSQGGSPSPAKPKSADAEKPKPPAPSPKKAETAAAEKKATPPKPAEKPAAPAAEPKNAPQTAEAKPKTGDGEFGNDDDDKQTGSNPAPAPPAVHQPLPTNTKNTGWEIVKVGGRDYVTGESIHNFYRFSSYKVDGKHVWLRSNNLILKATIGSQEMLINNIKFILSFPVLESSGRALFSRLDLCKLIDPVLRPTYISDAEPFDTVVVDAGHGGHDAGARGVYGYEKDFALRMSYAVKDALQKKGFKVVLTRPTDTFITLGGRVAIANATPRSIFISLHFNSGGSAATGIETFALTPQGSAASLERGGGYNAYGLTGNSHDSANIALATAVHAMVISRFKFVDRGIKRAQWSVLTGCKRPGILFEGGFVTNGNECRLIASETYRTSVAGAIADAVVNYRTALRGAMTKQR